MASPDITEIVDDPKWQALRASFVGTWKARALRNIAELRRYLGEVEYADNAEYELRLRRVHNYLTGSGFRIGVIAHPAIDRLLEHVRREREYMDRERNS